VTNYRRIEHAGLTNIGARLLERASNWRPAWWRRPCGHC